MNTSDTSAFLFDQNDGKLWPILLILLMLTMPMIFWSDLVDDRFFRSTLEWFVLFIFALCLGSLLLEMRARDLAHWVFLIGLSGLIMAGAVFLNLSALLSLLFVPVGLACFYFGMRPAFHFAVSTALVTIAGAEPPPRGR